MPDVIDCLIQLFADDSKLYSAIADQDDQATLQSSINKLCEWTEEWKMSLNMNKCKHMEIGNITRNSNYTLPDNDETIPVNKVTNEKDLAVTFDPKL